MRKIKCSRVPPVVSNCSRFSSSTLYPSFSLSPPSPLRASPLEDKHPRDRGSRPRNSRRPKTSRGLRVGTTTTTRRIALSFAIPVRSSIRFDSYRLIHDYEANNQLVIMYLVALVKLCTSLRDARLARSSRSIISFLEEESRKRGKRSAWGVFPSTLFLHFTAAIALPYLVKNQ